jgi:hypothetical protein
MLSTEHLDGTDPAALTPRALCLVPRVPISLRRTLLSPRVAYASRLLPELTRLCPTSAPWHRAPCRASSFASTSVHWGITSRWAHVTTIYFICFRYILYMFQLDVTKVDLVLHMLQWLCTYVGSVCFKYFQLFQIYVASVLSICYICCTSYTRILQVYVLNVSLF